LAEEAVKLCDENTIGVVAILGSTFDGSYEPVQAISAALDAFETETGIDVPVHVDGASGAMIAPNTSGHKYGLVYPGVGWIVWRESEALPEDLIFFVNYLGDNMPTFALNFSRPGSQVVAQYYNFLRLGFSGYRRVQTYGRDVAMRLSAQIAELGPFELLTRGDELPVFAFTLKDEVENFTASTSRTRCASAPGSSLRTRSRRTAPTSQRFVSSYGAGSPTTWPTCSSTT